MVTRKPGPKPGHKDNMSDKKDFESLMAFLEDSAEGILAAFPHGCPPVKHVENLPDGKDHAGNTMYVGHTTLFTGGDYVKLIGVTSQEFMAEAHQWDPGLQWKATPGTPGSEEGFLSYPAKHSSKYKLIKNGKHIHKPCGHLVAAVVSSTIKEKAKIAQSGGSLVTIWSAKLKFNKYSDISHYKHMAAKINESHACGCQIGGYPTKLTTGQLSNFGGTVVKVDPLTQPAPDPQKVSVSNLIKQMKAAQATVEKKPTIHVPPTIVEKPTWEMTWEPVVGAPLSAGDEADVPSAKREVMCATAGFYILEEIEVRLMLADRERPEGPRRLDLNRIKHKAFVERFRSFRRAYGKRLARNFFDFCVMCSYGEARYRDGSYYALGHGKASNRSTAYARAIKYDPRHLIPMLERTFCYVQWGGSDNTGYGGPRWGNIASAARYLYQFPDDPAIIIDHCVDLVHNGGLAFNKGYIIGLPKDEDEYMQMLDRKRDGCLLDWKHKIPVPSEVLTLYLEACSLGVLPTHAAEIIPAADNFVPTITWGLLEPKGCKYLVEPLDKPIKWESPKTKKAKAEQPTGAVSNAWKTIKKKAAALKVQEHYPEERTE